MPSTVDPLVTQNPVAAQLNPSGQALVSFAQRVSPLLKFGEHDAARPASATTKAKATWDG
jgi:hypothetical protein